MLPTFRWTTFDVSDRLPPGWRQDTRTVADGADFREFPRTPVISREAAGVRHVSRGRVHAGQVADGLPWLVGLYRGLFRDLAEQTAGEQVAAARDERYGVVLNVQRGTRMRFECHVDSNPVTGLLFCTDQDLRAGGELVFAHREDAGSAIEIERECSVIRPHSGHLIFFDGRWHPHYVRPLTAGTGIRIAAIMNYYTASCPESTRPAELNRHLYGDS